jgi:hypothetical protein
MLRPLLIAMIRRVLPCGYTAREAAGELYEELDDHVAANLDRLADVTERYGLRAALYLKAKAVYYEGLWLGRDWLELVEALAGVLADPRHDHWQVGGYPGPGRAA